MAPEQAMGRESGPATDVWALGLVLYKMLSGVSPHRERSTNEILAALHRGDVVPLAQRVDGIAPEILAVVDRAMAIDARDRYRDGAELVTALEPLRKIPVTRPVLRKSATAALAPTVKETPRRREAAVERQRTRFMLPIASALVGGAAVAAFLVTREGPPPPIAPSTTAEEATPTESAATDARVEDAAPVAPVASPTPPTPIAPPAPNDAALETTRPPSRKPKTIKHVEVLGTFNAVHGPEDWPREDLLRADAAVDAKLQASAPALEPCLRGLPIGGNHSLTMRFTADADGSVIDLHIDRSSQTPNPPALTPELQRCMQSRLRSHIGTWNAVNATAELSLTLLLQ
jgi:hypothetical protein